MQNQINKALVVSTLTYFVFFFRVLDPSMTIYSGRDSTGLHYPFRFYLYEKLKEGTFPFWTERIFSGFPIYADIESGYLNLLNVLLIYLLGPINSYKILHFGFYIAGSLSLYIFLKRRGISLKGFSVANIIYFFSFFFLYQQQHFNIVLTLYLLPTLVLLMDLYTSKKSGKYLVLSSIVTAFLFYFGSAQSIIILIAAQFLYLFVIDCRINLKRAWPFLIFVGMSLIFILPTLLPTADLYSKSRRESVGTRYTEGSFSPSSIVNILYPFAFGYGKEYFGTSVNPGMLKHEVYVYTGISALLLSLFGIASIEDNLMKRYAVALMTTFFILGFVGYIPVLNKFLPVPLSLFRYWGRSVVLFNFSAAIFAASFVSSGYKLYDKKIIVNILKYASVLVVAAAMFLTINIKDGYVLNTFKYMSARTTPSLYLFVWVVLFFTCLFLLIRLTLSKSKSQIIDLFVLMLFFDLVFFGSLVLKDAFIKKDGLISGSGVLNRFENERILVLDDSVSRNMGLYYKFWGIFGYSQFSPLKYEKLVESIGFVRVKEPLLSSSQARSNLVENAKKLGVFRMIDEGVITSYFINPIFEGNKEVVEQREGYIKARIRAVDSSEIQTYIRSDAGWKAFVNGREVGVNMSDVFIKIKMPAGDNTVEFRYVPSMFYIGMTLFISFNIGLIFLYKFRPKFFDYE